MAQNHRIILYMCLQMGICDPHRTGRRRPHRVVLSAMVRRTDHVRTSQDRVTDYLKEYPGGRPTGEPTEKYKEIKQKEPGRLSEDGAVDRTVGSFCCVNPNIPNLQLPTTQFCGCCIGNAGRVLYYTCRLHSGGKGQ